MSLTQFVQRPAIKNAFKTYATKERTPPCLRRQPILVQATPQQWTLVGTAFDYLARFKLARQLRNSRVEVHNREWIADSGAEKIEKQIIYPNGDEFYADSETICDEMYQIYGHDYRTYFWDALAEARLEAESYIGGGGDIRKLADLSQCLAQLDVAYRTLSGFNPSFRPRPDVSDELIKLLELFDPVTRFLPQQHCLLNPVFAASADVGGADADLVIDNRLIDLKVTVKPSVTGDQLLQLSGYAALHRMGGITYPDYEHKSPLQTVELYFARQGVLVQWRIDELFPDGGFERFCAIFKEEVSAFASETEEWRRQLGLDRVEPTK